MVNTGQVRMLNNSSLVINLGPLSPLARLWMDLAPALPQSPLPKTQSLLILYLPHLFTLQKCTSTYSPSQNCHIDWSIQISIGAGICICVQCLTFTVWEGICCASGWQNRWHSSQLLSRHWCFSDNTCVQTRYVMTPLASARHEFVDRTSMR